MHQKGRERALYVFKRVDQSYEVIEKHPSRFRLCIGFMSHGTSFRMASNLVNVTKCQTGIGRFDGCTQLVAARYARVVCAASLQQLSNLMKSV